MNLPTVHTPVLLHEVIENLDIRPGDIFLDGTVGSGGHSAAAAAGLGAEGIIIGLDLDGEALKRAEERLRGLPPKVILRQESFRNLDKVLAELLLEFVDKILFDLGLSSEQLEASGRGFSFLRDEPLQMTFRDSPAESDITASDIVNKWDEENLFIILKNYGEERFARRIARKIAESRIRSPIRTARELAELVKEAVPAAARHLKIHPATKTFQALRMTVNDEVQALKEGLLKGYKYLKTGGRMAVISFHSIEDRLVKNFMREKAKEGGARIISKKPIVPGAEEMATNPRSRSAKLRVMEKIGEV